MIEAAVRGYGRLLAAGQVDIVQIVVAGKGYPLAIGRKGGIGLASIGQLTQTVRLAVVEVIHPGIGPAVDGLPVGKQENLLLIGTKGIVIYSQGRLQGASVQDSGHPAAGSNLVLHNSVVLQGGVIAAVIHPADAVNRFAAESAAISKVFYGDLLLSLPLPGTGQQYNNK